jgi:hypothetical protein
LFSSVKVIILSKLDSDSSREVTTRINRASLKAQPNRSVTFLLSSVLGNPIRGFILGETVTLRSMEKLIKELESIKISKFIRRNRFKFLK